MMQFRFWTAAIVCTAGALSASDAMAQSNMMFGGNGALSGGSGFGAGSSPAMGSAFGSLPGTSGMPSSGMPSSSMPTNSMPSNSMPGMSGTAQQFGAAGQRAGLVGQQSTRLAGVSAAGPQTNTGMNQNFNRNTGRGGQRGNQDQNPSNQPTRTVRPQLNIAFATPVVSPQAMTAKLGARMKKIQRAGFEGVSVEVDGRTAILRGEVASEQDKRLAKMLVKLEPGIRSVQNELVVVSPEPLPVE